MGLYTRCDVLLRFLSGPDFPPFSFGVGAHNFCSIFFRGRAHCSIFFRGRGHTTFAPDFNPFSVGRRGRILIHFLSSAVVQDFVQFSFVKIRYTFKFQSCPFIKAFYAWVVRFDWLGAIVGYTDISNESWGSNRGWGIIFLYILGSSMLVLANCESV